MVELAKAHMAVYNQLYRNEIRELLEDKKRGDRKRWVAAVRDKRGPGWNPDTHVAVKYNEGTKKFEYDYFIDGITFPVFHTWLDGVHGVAWVESTVQVVRLHRWRSEPGSTLEPEKALKVVEKHLDALVEDQITQDVIPFLEYIYRFGNSTQTEEVSLWDDTYIIKTGPDGVEDVNDG
jgi:hypothetical protein